MRTGWIKIYRSIQESCTRRGYGADTLGVMVWLLVSANYVRTEHPILGTLQPGELVASISAMSNTIHISKKRLWNILEHLQRDGFLSFRGYGKVGTRITIENYPQYQGENKWNEKGQNEPLTTSMTYEEEGDIKGDINEKKEQKREHKKERKGNEKGQNEPLTTSMTYEEEGDIKGDIKGTEKGTKTGTSLKEVQEVVVIKSNHAPAREEISADDRYSDATFCPYPQTAKEIVDAANRQGLLITEEQALEFRDYYNAVGWVDRTGRKITQWMYLLRYWLNSPARRISMQRLQNETTRGEREALYLHNAQQPRAKSASERALDARRFSGDYSEVVDESDRLYPGTQKTATQGEQ